MIRFEEMRLLYCICAVLLASAAPALAQQPAAAPASAPPTTGYMVFVRGTAIGREDVAVQQDATGLTITATGRIAAPLNIITRRAEVKYRPDGTPEYLTLDASIQGGDINFRTSFSDVTALSEGVVQGQKISHTDVGSLRPFVLPNIFFTSYEAVARRLSQADVGKEQGVFLSPQAPEASFRLTSITAERMQIGTTAFDVRRFTLTFERGNPGLIVNLYADTRGTMMRLNVPSQGLDVLREDLAASTSRTLVYSNPGDEGVVIPAPGFNLGATLTKPPATATRPASGRYPAVILLGPTGVSDRDGVMSGVPVLGQLAGALANAGFIVIRYDKRGSGQSGGRAESVTMSDYADDARAVVRWLVNRPDVDRDRIAVAGHSEGAWVALLAATRENRVKAIVSIAAAAVSGNELVLEQQRQALDDSNTPPADRAERIEQQNKINAAVMTGRGWEGIAPEVRSQADTPWFQSYLTFNPGRVLEDVEQPVLIVHGQLDRQIPVSHAERLAEMARTTSDSKAVALTTVRGVNHLLAPAITGQVAEYAVLQDRNVSADVTTAITSWLVKTLPARP